MLKIALNQQISAKFLRIMKESPEKMSKVAKVALRRCGDQMRNDAGQNAPYLSGNLRRSITMEQVSDKKVIVGTNLEYARIHDQGGIIYPKKGKYLRFKIGGKWIFAKKVTIRKYKGKGYFTPAFEKLADGDAGKIFTEEIMEAIK